MADTEFNESNIFKELTGELDFGDENSTNSKEIQIKDLMYYLKLSTKVLLIGNVIIFIILVVLFSYVKIQNNEDLVENSYLNPICAILVLGEVSGEIGDCSSVRALSYKYNNSISQIKNEATKKIVELAPIVSTLKNLALSKDVKFLVDKTQNRNKPLLMFEEFDKLKNSFASRDKGQIKCSNLEIVGDDFNISCSSYTSDWNTSIQTRDAGKKVSGTSISLAANFIDYIEKNSKVFEIVNKPKSFSRDDFSGNGYYTKKTDFNLNLRYSQNNINNF